MAKFIIVCGLMGCGKTEFAKNFGDRFGYQYIDFDWEFHDKIQTEKRVIDERITVPWFLERIAKILRDNPNMNFITDNWFGWSKDWFKKENDDTLERLKEITNREIEIIYLFVPFDEVKRRYMKGHGDKKDWDEYFPEMEERQENLLKKIKEGLK